MKMKGFLRDCRLGTSGEGVEPIKAIPSMAKGSPPSVFMFARGLREAATGEVGKGREEQ